MNHGATKTDSKVVDRYVEAVYPNVYANHVQLFPTVYDVRLNMSVIEGVVDGGATARRDLFPVVTVRMSPRLAKQVVILLGEYVDAYEQQFGDVKV